MGEKTLDLCMPTNEDEFVQMMLLVDASLRETGALPAQRPIRAVLTISQILKLGLRMSAPDRDPRTGAYEGEDLTIRIHQWYRDQYGDKLRMPMSLGRVVLLIREETWIAELPSVIGSVRFVLNMNAEPHRSALNVARNGPVECNILDAIIDLPVAVRCSLTTQELHAIGGVYTRAFQDLCCFSDLRGVDMLDEIRSDLRVAVDHLAGTTPHFGQSKWSSLQATEKMLKSFIRSSGGSPPNTHRLEELVKIAVLHGLTTVDQTVLARIQCSPDVRYGQPECMLLEAHGAHIGSIEVIGRIAKCLLAPPASSRPAISP